jgi:hypothetical protein
VTAGRIEGVGTPSGRPSAGEDGTADGETRPQVDALVREAADTALEGLDTLEHQARDIARRFRRGAQEEAQRGLAHLMQSLQTVLRLAAVAAVATGTDLETLCERFDVNPEGQTNAAVNELIRCQVASDASGLATALDRWLTPALTAWRRVFVLLGGTPAGPYGDAA